MFWCYFTLISYFKKSATQTSKFESIGMLFTGIQTDTMFSLFWWSGAPTKSGSFSEPCYLLSESSEVEPRKQEGYDTCKLSIF